MDYTAKTQFLLKIQKGIYSARAVSTSYHSPHYTEGGRAYEIVCAIIDKIKADTNLQELKKI